jgi:hypothetical protein
MTVPIRRRTKPMITVGNRSDFTVAKCY